MKNMLCLFCFLLLSANITAQSYPPEWIKYTSDGYIYDIQNGINDNNLPEVDFKNYLVDIARTNIAKQIQICINDVTILNKNTINGRTDITYFSKTIFSTKINLRLLETKVIYKSAEKKGYAIAYIDLDAAYKFYEKELTVTYNKINNKISITKDYISSGFKAKAQQELESTLKLFTSVDETLFWLNIFGASPSELEKWQENLNIQEQKIKSMLIELEHGTVIYLSCTAYLFKDQYTILTGQIKGILSEYGCSFTDTPTNADFVITIKCHSRKHSHITIGKTNTYFSYVDANISIDKMIASQRIYQNELSVKGGHTSNYIQAANNAYNNLLIQIKDIIIKQTQ